MAIVKPNEMDFSDKNLNIIISGLPGVGKTTLALSAPGVVLIDTDEGMARVSPAHRKDASIVSTYEELLADIKGFKDRYQTVVFDTTGALIELMKDWATRTEPSATKKSGGFSIQGYGIVKSEYLRLMAELRKKFNVISLFHENMTRNSDDTFYELVCEGSARSLVWQPADLGAHLHIMNGERYLGFTPTSNYNAKSAYGIKGLVKVPELKDGDPNDFLTRLFARVKENLAQESKENAVVQEAYDAVMANGMAMIAGITTVDDIAEIASEIKRLNHVLTSEKELRARLKTRLDELNIAWDKEKKAYVQR